MGKLLLLTLNEQEEKMIDKIITAISNYIQVEPMEIIPCVLSEIRSPARGTEFPDGDGAFKGGRGKGGRRRLCKPA